MTDNKHILVSKFVKNNDKDKKKIDLQTFLQYLHQSFIIVKIIFNFM